MTSAGDVTARLPSNGGANPSTNTDEKWFCTLCVRRYGGWTGCEEMHARAVPAKLPLLSVELERARARSSSLSFLT